MSDGWIKMHRQLKSHPRFQDSEWVHIWVWLLLSATHGPIRRVFGTETVILNPGQLITSRRTISAETGICESKVERVLKRLQIEQQIEQRSCAISRLITVCNWLSFQESEQVSELRVNTNRTPTEQQVNTNKKTRTEEGLLGVQGLEVELPSGFPKTEADAVTAANFVGVPPDFAVKVYDKAVSRGGRDGRDIPVRNFGGYLRVEWKYEQDRVGKEKRNGNHRNGSVRVTQSTPEILPVPTEL